MGYLTINGRTAACGLAAGDRPGRCSWCGKVRPSHRRRWCSDRCGHLFYANHRWATAREVAKARAGYACERCGSTPLEGLEVHHRVEVDLQHGYRDGCAHHQGPALTRRFLLRVVTHVRTEGMDPLEVIAEHPEAGVAGATEDPSDLPSGVAVVYVRADLGEAALADGTRVPLIVEHLPVALGGKTVVETEVRGLGGAPLGAIEGILPGDPGAAAEQTGHWLLGHFSQVPGSAATIAVERSPASPIEGGCALEAAVSDGPTVEVAVATESRVVAQAELGSLVDSPTGATCDDARLVRWQATHSRIIVGVGRAGMPPQVGGLEVLCGPCHKGEHSFRHEVERLLVWADGQVSRQLVLPGIPA